MRTMRAALAAAACAALLSSCGGTSSAPGPLAPGEWEAHARDVIGIMEPSKRSFATRAMSTTEAALLTRGVSQLYLSLGDPNADGSIAIRLYHKPLVLLIWLGAVVMVAGGGLSLSDRRLRVGAPRPAKVALQPAE